ncbi:hypothetical protein L3X38_039707 [Prunus dulcis]|uniref:Uncharacterized protein n=1 Tax=Prunus dulcis TaxID=3755 RepID=A0AAD4V8Y6_PRUDU|nr:hypothetical protein L3X38_039707 [Prunus dulcis]
MYGFGREHAEKFIVININSVHVFGSHRSLISDLAELVSRIIVLEQLNSKPPLLLGSSYFKGAQEEMMEAERAETMEVERDGR